MSGEKTCPSRPKTCWPPNTACDECVAEYESLNHALNETWRLDGDER